MSSISRAPSSSSKDIATSHESPEPEESGWTMYFEDFFNNNRNNNVDVDDDHNHKCSMSLSGDATSSALISDAASTLAVNKLAVSQHAEEFSASKHGKRTSFKKRKKIKTALVDEALEDTASSPLNSPKVLYENQLDKPKQKEEQDLFQEKGNSSGQRDERKELGFNGRDSDCTELKKKGLCLVPLSMVVNYLG